MQRNCVLCYNREGVITSEKSGFQISAGIVAGCNKYLSYEIVQTVAWTGVHENGLIFCQQCFINIEKLLCLNDQLELLQLEISKFASDVNQEILKERQTYESNNQIPPFEFSSEQPVNEYLFESVTSTIILNSVPVENTKEVTSPHRLPALPTSNCNDISQSEVNADHWKNADENGENCLRTLESNSVANKKEMRIDEVGARPITSSDLEPFLEKGSAGFQCKKCFKKFGRLTILQRHDCDKITFNCDLCGLAFSSQGVLKLHISRTHSGDKPFKCETCGKGFGFKHHLVLHIRSHTGEKPYECDVCCKRFSDSTSYYNHKRKHESNVRYNCDICNKSYATVKALKYHVKVHLGTSNYKCETCGRAFASRKTLTNHQLTHTGEKTHFCDQCGKGFSNLRSLQTHILRHTGEKPITCPLCDKCFRSSPHLRQHTIIVHEKPETFICDVCGKTCTNSVQYKHHLKGHKQPIRECPTCDKKFKYKHSLEMHIKTTHDGLRPIKCDLCSKSFKYYSALGRHKERNCRDEKIREKTHIRCTICKRSYKGKEELLKHQLIVHSVTAGLYVICEKCNQKFLDLGGYQWHLLALHGSNQFKCRKCKNKRTLYPTCCDFFSHCNIVHDGMGNHFNCGKCGLTMSTKNLKSHKCSSSDSTLIKNISRTKEMANGRYTKTKSTKFNIVKSKKSNDNRKKRKHKVESETSDNVSNSEAETLIKQEFEEIAEEVKNDDSIAIKSEPESEEESDL